MNNTNPKSPFGISNITLTFDEEMDEYDRKMITALAEKSGGELEVKMGEVLCKGPFPMGMSQSRTFSPVLHPMPAMPQSGIFGMRKASKLTFAPQGQTFNDGIKISNKYEFQQGRIKKYFSHFMPKDSFPYSEYILVQSVYPPGAFPQIIISGSPSHDITKEYYELNEKYLNMLLQAEAEFHYSQVQVTNQSIEQRKERRIICGKWKPKKDKGVCILSLKNRIIDWFTPDENPFFTIKGSDLMNGINAKIISKDEVYFPNHSDAFYFKIMLEGDWTPKRFEPFFALSKDGSVEEFILGVPYPEIYSLDKTRKYFPTMEWLNFYKIEEKRKQKPTPPLAILAERPIDTAATEKEIEKLLSGIKSAPLNAYPTAGSYYAIFGDDISLIPNEQEAEWMAKQWLRNRITEILGTDKYEICHHITCGHIPAGYARPRRTTGEPTESGKTSTELSLNDLVNGKIRLQFGNPPGQIISGKERDLLADINTAIIAGDEFGLSHARRFIRRCLIQKKARLGLIGAREREVRTREDIMKDIMAAQKRTFEFQQGKSLAHTDHMKDYFRISIKVEQDKISGLRKELEALEGKKEHSNWFMDLLNAYNDIFGLKKAIPAPIQLYAFPTIEDTDEVLYKAKPEPTTTKSGSFDIPPFMILRRNDQIGIYLYGKL